MKDYNSLIKHLKGFAAYSRQQINFNSFDYALYDEFINYLYYYAEKPNGEIGLYTNSVGKQIKNLKAFLRERAKHVILSQLLVMYLPRQKVPRPPPCS